LTTLNSKSLLASGFATVVLLMGLTAGIGISIVNSSVSRIDSLVLESKQKSSLIAQMRRITRERTVSLQKMFIMQDPFARDEEAQIFHSYGNEFITARDKLQALPLSNEETNILRSILSIVSINAPFQLDLADRILSDELAGIQQELDTVAIPRQEHVYEKLTNFLNYEEQASGNAVSEARDAYNKALYLMTLLAVLVLVLSGVIAFFVIKCISVTEKRLFHEMERAHITLHSIGDAVITTDRHGSIEQMNAAAEVLTGVERTQAQGLPYEKVLFLSFEMQGLPGPSPLDEVLSDGDVKTSDGDVLLVRPDKTELAIEYTAAPIYGRSSNVTGAILVFRDVTETRALSHQLAYQVRHDPLTSLFNRRELEVCLEHALAEVRRYPARISWLCCIDLDQFKLINDSCGHIAGDELLKQIAAILQSRLREMDTVCRMGGDEFAMLLSNCSREDALRIADGIRCGVEEFRFAWGEQTYNLTASIGITPVTPDSGSTHDLLSAADTACYIAKEAGRNRIHSSDDNSDNMIVQRANEIEMVHRLNRALETGGFALYGQLIKPLSNTGGRLHIEILLRMLSADGEITPPMAFIPAAERYSLMPRIDRWVVTNTLRLFSGNRAEETDSACCICINLSAQSICDAEFLPFVLAQLDNTGLPCSDLCFEITETAAIANLTNAMKFIGAVKEKGCRFALDDFGSGLSSFAYLKNLPVDYLKIDGCFVRDMMDDPIDHAMVESISQIGRVMGIETIAEYVENTSLVETLSNIGVDYAQGYGIARPVPVASLAGDLAETAC
jgi:diguanylate cyclase (GGDEF)-like protein/PAS domain S-box-containing protein